ncbi:hypothetical protein RUM44_002318 [Polyplax serrata]|uniref:Uncharacterized protein n=1 Tax=Polyplax serrata TaxID=468196 RepID=A0ABR1AML5_POLSC
MTEMKTLFWDSDDVPSTGSSVLRVALEQELVATSVTDTQNLDDCRHFFKGSFENNSEYRKNFKTVSGLVELIKRLMAVCFKYFNLSENKGEDLSGAEVCFHLICHSEVQGQHRSRKSISNKRNIQLGGKRIESCESRLGVRNDEVRSKK